jgi:cephalosporin hydroxylase
MSFRKYTNFTIAGCLILTAAGCRKTAPVEVAAVSEIVLASPGSDKRIRQGVYPGTEGWRWTGPFFAVALDPPPASKQAYLEMDFSVTEELMKQAAAVTVAASVNGAEVTRVTYDKPGRNLLASKIPAEALAKRPAQIEFRVDRSFTDADTGRQLSLIVVSVGLKEYEQTAEFREAELAKSHEAYENVLKQRNLRVPVEKQREMMKLFHTLPTWQSLRFHNVPILKNPLDLWMLQQIAHEVRPDFVIETGTWQGGSALYWAHTLNGMGVENARVLTIDVQDLTKQGASSHPLWKKYVEFFQGSSTDPALVARIVQRVKDRRVIVNLDSDHSMKHVLEELRLYAPLVSPGSYIAVEDTHLDGIPTHPEQGAGPTAAIRQFLTDAEGKKFEQDFSREAILITSYPGGWLRRK